MVTVFSCRQRGIADAVPPHVFIIGSGLIQYVGAALAVSLFAVMMPAEVAWWRVTIAALVFLLWRRPWREGLTARDIARSGVFGAAMTLMNITFYQAIAYLPLGVAVSLEFIGPVAVAVFRGRGWVPRVAAVLAFVGVAFIGGLGVDIGDPGIRAGVAWILVAAAMWAVYIVLGQKIASTRSGVTNLSVGATVGAVVTAPFFAGTVPSVITDWRLFALLLGVAVLSTVLPYSLEAVAMSRVSASVFALFAALLPATSTLVGAVMLRQLPSVGDLVGLVLISVAVALATRA